MNKKFFINHSPGEGAPFPIDPVLTGIAVSYKNRGFIADEVLPRVPVSQLSFKYNTYPLNDNFQSLNTAVGRKGKPQEIELSATELTESCINQALDDAIPYDDIEDAPANYNPEARAVETLTDLIDLKREVRAAAVVFATGSYASGFSSTPTKTWDDTTDGVPLSDLMGALDVPFMRPNIMTIGQGAWTKLRQHPHIVQAVFGSAQSYGVVTREQLAAVLELEKIVVGLSYYNSAKKGQAASLAAIWGKHCSLLYIDHLADTRGGVTFGFTAQKGTKLAGSKDDDSIGARGGKRVRVIDTVIELAVANKAGYLFANCVA